MNHIEKYLQLFLSSEQRSFLEYEIRFGTKHSRITRSKYENVLSFLKSQGFHISNSNSLLRIKCDNHDIRTDIEGVSNIQVYCKNDSIDNVLSDVQFNQKTRFVHDGEIQYPKDYNDFGFRVSLQQDKDIEQEEFDDNERHLVEQWGSNKKIFRLIKRLHATNPIYPGIRIDLSVVKSSNRDNKGKLISEYTVKQSGVLSSPLSYEVEIEYTGKDDNDNVLDDINPTQALQSIKSCITHILRGLQDTYFPVSFSKLNEIQSEYVKLIHRNQKQTGYIKPRDFIGPSSISLEMQHITPLKDDEKTSRTTIYNDYCVTDKADGYRKLLYISGKSGAVYLINTQMDFQYTGMICKKSQYYNCLLDGEHITRSRDGTRIHYYAIFDIYYYNGKDIRNLPFLQIESSKDEHTRFDYIKNVMDNIEYKHEGDKNQLQVIAKTFMVSSSILSECKKILDQKESYLYEIDGLIFTPITLGVGMENETDKIVNHKKTWTKSFKWKPPEFNTVDFLILDKGNVKSKYVQHSEKSIEYKTITLCVGYDANKHGLLNPCDTILENNIAKTERGYKYIPFPPSSIMNVEVVNNHLFTENLEDTIEDLTIVECRYDKDREDGWKWIPIRLRKDKTEELRNGFKNYGNAYHVALSVWDSIHQPIHENMIKGLEDIPELNIDVQDDIYYNNDGTTSETSQLRTFHNQFVKRTLIQSVSKPGNTLVDLAVGKGGDINKWLEAKLSFVFGIDVSPDNINNRADGACSRYIRMKQKVHNLYDAIFIEGNSGYSIKDGTAFSSDKNKQITQQLFALEGKDQNMPHMVKKHYGIAKDGFDIVSCQFAMHYFFKDKLTLHSFMVNVSDMCKIDGYFIGTCYDGIKVHELLKDKTKGESISIYKNEKEILNITKRYDEEFFANDDTSLGYEIGVYQESINKTFSEYLVNFYYVVRIFGLYGFTLISRDEANEKHLHDSMPLFEDLYKKAEQKHKKNPSKWNRMKMDDTQKKISFLNRAFIFKKTNSIPDYIRNKPQIIGSLDSISYPSRKDRKQKTDIIRILNEIYTNEDQYNRFQRILRNLDWSSAFDSNRFIQYVFEQKQKHGLVSDYTLYKGFVEHYENQENDNANSSVFQRGKKALQEVKQLMTLNKSPKPTMYLDYSCGDGEITRAIQKEFNLGKDQVYGSDIMKYPSIGDDFQFILKTKETTSLPLQDNMFDLITVFNVLHHIKEDELYEAIKDLHRMLKPGGILLLKEHNAPIDREKRESFTRVEDILHDMYDFVIDNEMNWDDEDYYARYKSLIEWDNSFKTVGFKLLPKQKKLIMDIQRNPQNKYTRIYTKILDDKRQEKTFPKKLVIKDDDIKSRHKSIKVKDDIINDNDNNIQNESTEINNILQSIEEMENVENDGSTTTIKKPIVLKKDIENDIDDIDIMGSHETDLFDDDVIFQYYNRSASKPPGKGIGESITENKKKDYNLLLELDDWRRKLSTHYMKEFECDNKHWASIEHYYQAHKFMEGHPEFAHLFTVESGSEISKNIDMAKAAGEKNGKFKRKQIRPVDITIDERFTKEMQEKVLENAFSCMYRQHPEQRKILLATNRAKLQHYIRGQPSEVSYALMKVRKQLK